jgi:hypothetical protein
LPDLVANLADAFDRLALGIGQRPVVFREAGNVRACVTAPHRDQEGGTFRELASQESGAGLGQVDAGLSHDGHDLGMDGVARLRARRNGGRLPGIGQPAKEGCGHL